MRQLEDADRDHLHSFLATEDLSDLSPTDADRVLLNAFLATKDSSDLSPTARMPDSAGPEVISAQNLSRHTRRPRRPFSSDEVGFLQAGVARFGAGQWKKILATYKFADHRMTLDLKNTLRNLSKAVQRVEQQQSVPVRPLSMNSACAECRRRKQCCLGVGIGKAWWCTRRPQPDAPVEPLVVLPAISLARPSAWTLCLTLCIPQATGSPLPSQLDSDPSNEVSPTVQWCHAELADPPPPTQLAHQLQPHRACCLLHISNSCQHYMCPK